MLWKRKNTPIENRKDSGDKNRERQDNQDNVEIVRALNRMTREQEASHKQEHAYESKKDLREWLTIIGLFFTAAFGLGQGIVFYISMKDARHAASTQHNDSIAALRIATDANGEARRAADAAQNSQRAWIAVTKFSFADLNDPADPLKVRVFYQNVGREPAKSVRNSLGVGYIRLTGISSDQWGNIPEWANIATIKPDKICKRAESSPKKTVVYPSSTFGLFVDTSRPPDKEISGNLTPILFNEVKNQTSVYFVFGCFSYSTLNQTRLSSFCVFLNPAGGGEDISQWSFSACPVGNDDY